MIADVRDAILGAGFLIHSGLLLDMQHRCLVDSCTTLSVTGEKATLNSAPVISIAFTHPDRQCSSALAGCMESVFGQRRGSSAAGSGRRAALFQSMGQPASPSR